MIYEFRCLTHPAERREVICSMKERESIPTYNCSICGAVLEQDYRGHGGVKFARSVGRWTGVYDLDYGKRATEDLTVPYKMEMLKKEGRIKDPFDDVAPRTNFEKVDL